jgi:hypothetical protein
MVVFVKSDTIYKNDAKILVIDCTKNMFKTKEVTPKQKICNVFTMNNTPYIIQYESQNFLQFKLALSTYDHVTDKLIEKCVIFRNYIIFHEMMQKNRFIIL